MIASRLDVPVVPVRIDGLDRMLHHTLEDGHARAASAWRSARRMRLIGDDYEALASRSKTRSGRQRSDSRSLAQLGSEH